MPDARATIARAMSEEELQRNIIELAHALGWLVHHTRPANTGKGWRTPVQGDAGFPDLVLAKHGRILFFECKSQRGALEPAQQQWFEALIGAVASPLLSGHRVIRPSDWLDGTVERLLKGDGA